VIAQKADGGLRDACSIFDQMVAFTGNHLSYKAIVENLHVLDFDYYFKITDFLMNQKLPEIMVTFDDILKKGFDAHNFINGLGEHLRNVMVSRDAQTVQLLEISDNLKPKYADQAQKASLPFLLKCLALISKTDVNYKAAKNPRLLVEMCLMQMAYVNTAPSNDAEKKNELTESPFQTSTASTMAVNTATAVTTQPKTAKLDEKIVKTADKPIVPFSELKIKAQFSLKDVVKANMPSVNQTITEENKEVIFENKPFDGEMLMKTIHAFALIKNEAGNRQLFTTITTAKIEVSDTNVVTLNIHNEAQKEILTTIKQDFLDFVRKELSNNTIGLDIKIEMEVSAAAKAYKPSDKFKLLAEKNPSLLELKKRLDLELDY
jgi:DNA polymerase-3 subunit gamma/tau